MNAEANIALVREGIAALNRKDIEACVAMLTPNFLINLAGMPYQQKGTDAWRKNVGIMLTAFPDTAVHVDDIFAAGNLVAFRGRVTGTHKGEFLSHQATGKSISYQTHEFYRIEGGKIAEEWICSDMLTMMTQIGAISGARIFAMWLAGYRVWFALALGVMVGALLASAL